MTKVSLPRGKQWRGTYINGVHHMNNKCSHWSWLQIQWKALALRNETLLVWKLFIMLCKFW